MMMPGMFVRIRLPMGPPHAGLLVADRAVGSDQGLKFVYVVNAQGEIEYRRVETGPVEGDDLRVITKGLTADDKVVVSPLRNIQPGTKVQSEEVPMPAPQGPGAPAGDDQPLRGGNREAPKK